MQHTITLFPANGVWMAKDTDPQTRRLFGTDTLPTAFYASEKGETVCRAVQALNPSALVLTVEA